MTKQFIKINKLFCHCVFVQILTSTDNSLRFCKMGFCIVSAY